MKKLEMTTYLEGLKEMFDKCGVKEAYSFEPFTNTKEDGVVLWADIDKDGENLLMEYMDNHINQDETLPELRSYCIGTTEQHEGMHIIYRDGVFYE